MKEQAVAAFTAAAIAYGRKAAREVAEVAYQAAYVEAYHLALADFYAASADPSTPTRVRKGWNKIEGRLEA